MKGRARRECSTVRARCVLPMSARIGGPPFPFDHREIPVTQTSSNASYLPVVYRKILCWLVAIPAPVRGTSSRVAKKEFLQSEREESELGSVYRPLLDSLALSNTTCLEELAGRSAP
jgi:hypothetical protein